MYGQQENKSTHALNPVKVCHKSVAWALEESGATTIKVAHHHWASLESHKVDQAYSMHLTREAQRQ